MTVTNAIPALKDVKDVLTGLLGRDIEVSAQASAPSVGGGAGSLVAVYVDDHHRPAAAIVVDLALAARMGAAIGLIPPGGADAAIEDDVLPANLRENTAEVLNVLAALFNQDGAPHLRLESVVGQGDDLAPDVRALAMRPAPRENVVVDVSRYGRGVMSLILA